MAKTPPSSRGHSRTSAAAIKAERHEKLQKLLLRREKLNAAEIELFRTIYPEIIAAHQQSVWTRLYMARVYDEDAKELFQETFKAFFTYSIEHGFDEKLSWRIRSLLDGKISNFVRGTRRDPTSIGLPSSRSEKPKSGPDVEQRLYYHALVLDILSCLPPEQREVIELIDLKELSYSEAAAELNIAEGTLNSRLRAARRAVYELAKARMTPSERGAL